MKAMFTGIIEDQGRVVRLEYKKNLMTLAIGAGKVLKGTACGDSIGVDGVCLTVSSLKRKAMVFEVMRESILRTTLKDLKIGSQVNLERPLKASDRLGGHFVLGHIDGVGAIKEKIVKTNYAEFQIVPVRRLMPQIVSRGSIALDGISLTVGQVKKDFFTVYIVPHTLKVTTLALKKKGDRVNIETDILAKYILRKK